MSDFKTILLTTDFSETSLHAFAPALSVAEKFGAKLLLIYVEEDRLPPFAGELGSVRVGDILELHHERATKEIEHLGEAHLAGKVDYETIVVPGVPHREVVRIAEERNVDLIVIATHGRGFISHALFGSTTERVVRRSPCPVLTVRAHPPEE
jgi:nucleotide-binding universal stress UspA family protein